MNKIEVLSKKWQRGGKIFVNNIEITQVKGYELIGNVVTLEMFVYDEPFVYDADSKKLTAGYCEILEAEILSLTEAADEPSQAFIKFPVVNYSKLIEG